MSHSSHSACSRCTKYFPHDNTLGKIIYAGFDNAHPPRKQADHAAAGLRWSRADTLSKRNDIEKSTGSRFTELNRLPYFDCIRFIIIDPMHNLFLGTAKHVMKNIWMKEDNNVIDRQKFQYIHDVVQSVLVPSVGRIPRKIMTGFSNFSADQWKNWTLLFSLVALNGVIPTNDLECWRHFVKMCTLICTPFLSLSDIEQAHGHAIQFCQTVETVWETNNNPKHASSLTPQRLPFRLRPNILFLAFQF